MKHVRVTCKCDDRDDEDRLVSRKHIIIPLDDADMRAR